MANRDLFDVYRSTYFVVEVPGREIRLRIGQVNSEADRLLNEYLVTTAAFITAWNPGSLPLPATENNQRQQSMEQAIQVEGLLFLRGRGEGTDPTWPAEESVFVLGISKRQAIALANRFGQLAIVWHERGQASTLLPTSDGMVCDADLR